MSNRSETNSTFDLRGFASGLVIGGLAGTAIAFLTAPQSGRKTRAQIRQKTLELRDQAADQIDDAWQQAEDTVRRARLSTALPPRSSRTIWIGRGISQSATTATSMSPCAAAGSKSFPKTAKAASRQFRARARAQAPQPPR